MGSKSISVIVTSWNRKDLTERCLNALLASIVDKNLDYEIIVVDNASTNGTQDFLRKFVQEHTKIIPILNPDNRGFSGANNQGLDVSTKEYILFTQNDVFVGRGCLERSIKIYDELPQVGCIGVGGGELLCEGSSHQVVSKSAINGDDRGGYTGVRAFDTIEVGFVAGFFMLFHRDIINTYSIRWDEKYPLYWEDLDLCKQLTSVGLKCYLVSRSLIPFRHLRGATNLEVLGKNKAWAHAPVSGAYFRKKWSM